MYVCKIYVQYMAQVSESVCMWLYFKKKFYTDTAMDRMLDGLKIGGRRRIFLPAELAFSSRGLAPYVPPGAPVVLELSLYAEERQNFLPVS